MVRRDLAKSRSEARLLIEAGRVVLDGSGTPKPSTQVGPNTAVEVVGGGGNVEFLLWGRKGSGHRDLEVPS